MSNFNKMKKTDILNFDTFLQLYKKVEIDGYANQVDQSIPDPAVSVVIFTYQHRDYIRKAIDGILMQKTSFPYEIILGDDESSDGTTEICIEYAQRFPEKIKLYLHKRKNNKHVLGKPSLVFQYYHNYYQARGKYVAICSGDDFWTDPEKLEKQYQFLENNKGYSICYHPWIDRKVDVHGNIVSEKERKSFPKASTMMTLNMKNEFRKAFFDVIQEDVCCWFTLKYKGSFKCLEEVKPTIIHLLDTSVTNSISKDFTNRHVKNLALNLYLGFKNDKERVNEACYRLVHTLFSQLKLNKHFFKLFFENLTIFFRHVSIGDFFKSLVWRYKNRNVVLHLS